MAFYSLLIGGCALAGSVYAGDPIMGLYAGAVVGILASAILYNVVGYQYV